MRRHQAHTEPNTRGKPKFHLYLHVIESSSIARDENGGVQPPAYVFKAVSGTRARETVAPLCCGSSTK